MLYERIKAELLTARKAKDILKSALLRTLLGDLDRVRIEKGLDQISDEDCVKLINKFIKNAECVYNAGSNYESPRKQQALREIEILREYLPQLMSEEALASIIEEYINDGELETMGQIMKQLKADHAGNYDSKVAVDIIKGML